MLALALTFGACTSQENVQTGVENAVMKSYLNLKNALYEDDRAKAEIMAKNMIRNLAEFTPGDTTISGWQTAANEMTTDLQAIVSAREIAEQRVHFQKLSDAIYNHVQAYGLNSGTLYRQYCPMAFDNAGAYWLSDKEEIENPYFGAEMAHCGEVRDTLESR